MQITVRFLRENNSSMSTFERGYPIEMIIVNTITQN